MRSGRRAYISGLLAAFIANAVIVAVGFPWTANLAWDPFVRQIEQIPAREWKTFQKNEVAQHFNIPEAAIFVLAERRIDPGMGGGFLVVFQLPNIKTPQLWLKQMANKSGMAQCRIDSLKYDCSGDITRLEYIPTKGVFEAEYMWD
jgi:hypothetical protein